MRPVQIGESSNDVLIRASRLGLLASVNRSMLRLNLDCSTPCIGV